MIVLKRTSKEVILPINEHALKSLIMMNGKKVVRVLLEKVSNDKAEAIHIILNLKSGMGSVIFEENDCGIHSASRTVRDE